MSYNFNQLSGRLAEIGVWLTNEYAGIRTGQSTPALLDAVDVLVYGAKNKISHIASIGIEDPKTLRVIPWDKSNISMIERAIAVSNLGVSAVTDADGVRVIFPELTVERRAMLTKLVGEKLEEAKVSVRKEREEVRDDIKTKLKNKEMSEDDKKRHEDEMQKIVDEAVKKLEVISKTKEAELKN